MIFAQKMPEFYIKIALKKFFWILGGHMPPLSPSRLRQCAWATKRASYKAATEMPKQQQHNNYKINYLIYLHVESKYPK